MILRTMHLENYRCFKDFDIGFDERLTVLVGANGAGKTAVLDALSVFLKYAGHPVRRHDQHTHIVPTDVAIDSEPDDFIYRLEVQPSSRESIVSFQADFKFNFIGQDVVDISPTQAYDSLKRVLDETNPLFAAYMAGRFVSEEDSILKQNNHVTSTTLAFESGFDRTIDFASTISWFEKADAEEARAMRDDGLKEEQPELKALREALPRALQGQYERPSMRGIPPELVVYRKGTAQAYKFCQISDGYRAMLALVMDLARRMAQSRNNGLSKNTLESLLCTPAIVLIDEVELHLHPSWQQTVLTTLMDIFPNTQFIVTTHSPQVLTAIAPRHIRILSDGKAYTYHEQTEGAEASRLLKRIFGVEQRPAYLGIVAALNEYRNLVYNEKWDTPEAAELLKKLAGHFGNDDPELMELDLHIENRKWESGL